jgi:hypothetical protein
VDYDRDKDVPLWESRKSFCGASIRGLLVRPIEDNLAVPWVPRLAKVRGDKKKGGERFPVESGTMGIA